MGLYADSAARKWLVISVLFGAATLAIWLYVTFGVSMLETAFGQRWTSVEITLIRLPLGSVPGVPEDVELPLQFKPITGFMIFSFLWFIAACQSLKPQFEVMSSLKREVVMTLAFLLCLVAGYELVWNFMAFGAILASMPNAVAFNKTVDSVAFEYSYYPVSAVFATKMFSCAFAIGVYGIYFLRSLQKKGM
jgi:hypothetical protein